MNAGKPGIARVTPTVILSFSVKKTLWYNFLPLLTKTAPKKFVAVQWVHQKAVANCIASSTILFADVIIRLYISAYE